MRQCAVAAALNLNNSTLRSVLLLADEKSRQLQCVWVILITCNTVMFSFLGCSNHKCSLICASRALSFAPTTSPTFSPFLNSKKVGMALIPSSCATSLTSSTSTLKNLALGYCSLNFTTLGAMTLQGPHQVAKQSRTTRVEGSAPRISVSYSFLLRSVSTPPARRGGCWAGDGTAGEREVWVARWWAIYSARLWTPAILGIV
jgi:hypothetical protein